MLSATTFIINILILTISKSIGYAENPYVIIVAISIQSISLILDTLLAKNSFKIIRLQLLIGYLARLIILVVDIYGKAIVTIPQSGFDSKMYYNSAVLIMNNLQTDRGGLYSIIMGNLFKLIGSNHLFAQYINLMASMVVLFLISKILIDLKINEKVLYWSMWIICLFPTFTMLSVIFLREVFISMFVSISIYCFLKYLTNNSWIPLIISFLAILIGSALHSGILSLAIGYLIVLILYNNKEHTFTINIIGVLLSIVLAMTLLFIVFQNSETFMEKLNNVENIEDVANTRDSGGSSYAQFVGNSSNIVNMIIFTIPRMVFFLFSPLPFQWRNPIDAISFICSSALYVTSLYFSIRTITKSNNNLYKSLVISLLIIEFCGVFVFGWGVSNTGTALRHRDKLFSIFAIMLGISWSAWINENRQHMKK